MHPAPFELQQDCQLQLQFRGPVFGPTTVVHALKHIVKLRLQEPCHLGLPVRLPLAGSGAMSRWPLRHLVIAGLSDPLAATIQGGIIGTFKAWASGDYTRLDANSPDKLGLTSYGPATRHGSPGPPRPGAAWSRVASARHPTNRWPGGSAGSDHSVCMGGFSEA